MNEVRDFTYVMSKESLQFPVKRTWKRQSSFIVCKQLL